MLYRNLRIVPASNSVQWETEALEKLTPSTMGRLKKGEEEGKHEADAITEGGMSSSTVGMEVGMESEGRVHRVQDYVTSLEQGARPVPHTEGRDVITLDNDMRFDKVHIHTIEVNSLMYSHSHFRSCRAATLRHPASGVGDHKRKKIHPW